MTPHHTVLPKTRLPFMLHNVVRTRRMEGIWDTLYMMLEVVGTVEDCISARGSEGRSKVPALSAVRGATHVQHFLLGT